MRARIALLPGDGIGPEIISAARASLEAVARRFGHQFEFASYPIGGNAIDEFGEPLPHSSLEACRGSDAILLGAVGGPQWSDPDAKTRPEDGLLAIRKELGLFANVRPVRAFRQLLGASPLRAEIVHGVDIVFYRELTGGIYFGESTLSDDGSTATNVMRYAEHEIVRIIRLAAAAAMKRRKKLTSVDKANILEVSRLWRRVAARIVEDEFPELEYEVLLVDAMAMHLLARPRDFDVVVTGNLFGDILTDEASMLPGSLGLLPSASIGDEGPGLFEPIHGSAPDIAGQNVANPLATMLAAAMLLGDGLGLDAEAASLEEAVEVVLDSGLRTADIAAGGPAASTTEVTDAIVAAIDGV